MSKVKFTSNSGHEMNLERVQYTISDSFTMEPSGTLRSGVRVEIKAEMRRTEINNYLAWSNKGTSIQTRNLIGTLSFSDTVGGGYMEINNVYIISFSETSETWREWGTISATFSNENMGNCNSIVTRFRGLGGEFIVYNASLGVTLPVMRKNITAYHMYNGSFFQNTGYEVVRVFFSGIIPWDSCDFPSGIVSSLECFKPENGGLVPIEQNLSSFLPDISGFDLKNMFIESSSATWNIEKKIVNINVNFLGPHQLL